MKRLHVHVAVEDIAQSVRFYSTLFAAGPAVVKADYAKWMLEDSRVNFSARGGQAGLDHLGIQVETPDELHEVYGRLKQADRPVLQEGATTCCYAKLEKAWITDPQGLSWETFLTSGARRFTATAPISARSARHRVAWCRPLSVVLYIVVPVIVAQLWRRSVLASGGLSALGRTLRALGPLSLTALLLTLVLLFGLQGEQIMRQPAVIALLAVPILIQVYFNAGLAYWLNRRLGVAWCVAGPSALIDGIL